MTDHQWELFERSLSGLSVREKLQLVERILQSLRIEEATVAPEERASSGAERTDEAKPIWDQVQGFFKDVPEEDWAKLPTDLAEQHDHYIYGSPKRPAS